RRAAEEVADLLPLILTIKEQQPALTRSLVDADAEVRSLAGRALQDLTIPLQVSYEEETHPVRMPATRRTALVAPADVVRPSSFLPTSSSSRGPVELRDTVQALADQLGDANVETRRTALETLEAAGPDAAGAVPALLAALRDQDKF